MRKTEFGEFRHHVLRRLDNLRGNILLEVCHTLYSRMNPALDGDGRLTVQGANHLADRTVLLVEQAIEAAIKECESLINDPALDALIDAFHYLKFVDRYGQEAADKHDDQTVKSPYVRRSLRRRDAAARKIAAFYATMKEKEKGNGHDPGHA